MTSTSRWGSFCFLVLSIICWKFGSPYLYVATAATRPVCSILCAVFLVIIRSCDSLGHELKAENYVQYMLRPFSCSVLSVNEIHRNPERPEGLICTQIKSHRFPSQISPDLHFKTKGKILSADLLHHRKWCDRLFRKLVFLLNGLRVHISTVVVLYFLF